MANETLILADDLADRSAKGRLRSRLLRDNAIELARKMRLDIELLYVADLKPQFFNKKQLAFFIKDFDSIKGSVESEFTKARVPAQVTIRNGIPAEVILLETQLRQNARLLVLGTQGKKGLKKILLGSVAEEVIRNSSLPVFVLGPGAQDKRSLLKLDNKMQVVFFTDFSSASDSAEKFLLDFCRTIKCPVLIVHSVGEQILRIRESLYRSGDIPFDIEKMFKQMSEEAHRELEKKARLWSKEGLQITYRLLSKEERLENALKGPLLTKTGLIVMGTHGRNKVITSFLGSSARALMLKSPVPVIVVRSSEDQAHASNNRV